MFRWFALAILLGAVGISGFYRRRARQQGETIARRQEGGFLLAIRAMTALLLIFPVFAYLARPQWMSWASFAAPEWMRWIGFILGLLVFSAVAWVLGSLGRNVSETVPTKREQQLVTFGPYRWVRHPLYTTGITLFVALGLMEASWFMLVMAMVAALLILLLVIPAEERGLVAKFGEEYRAYMGRAGRLLPRMFGSN
jgi:protein-S-isoprenylcysteine O-methyltransferase Ste14